MEHQLSGLDSAFLSLETPRSPLHVAATLVLEPTPARGPAGYRRIREHLAPRLASHPIFRRRVRPVPFGLDHPFWTEESQPDLDAHLHRVAVPAPGSQHELAELVGQLAGRPLDRDLPLWEVWVVEGLEEGRTALLAKLHHALIDGVAGTAILAQLLDEAPDATGGGVASSLAERRPPPTLPAMFSATARTMSALPLRMARQMWRSAKTAARVARAATDGRWLPESTLAAPASPLNGALSARRAVTFGEVPVRELQEVKRALGVKLNDVVLAACAGALRRCLELWGDPPREPLVAAVPVAGPRDANAGNAISAMRVQLPVDVADPVERLLHIHRSSRQAKRLQRATGHDFLAGWAELVTPLVASKLARLYASSGLAERHPPLANLVISNLRGPSTHLYCAGHPVRACYPLGPIYEGWGLNLTVLSYGERVHLGLMSCPSVVPDPPRVCDAFAEASSELHRAATTPASGRPTQSAAIP